MGKIKYVDHSFRRDTLSLIEIANVIIEDYQARGLPFPVFSEVWYWADRIAQMGFSITMGEVLTLYERVKKNANR